MSYATNGYDIHHSVVRITGAEHPFRGKNARIVGQDGEGSWIAELLCREGGYAHFLCKAADLKYVPIEWQTSAIRYEPTRLMQFFDAPGQLQPSPDWRCAVKHSPPDLHATQAYWGNSAYEYMLAAGRSHTYAKKSYSNNEFFDVDSRIFGGLVWSDCNPNEETLAIDVPQSIITCSEWWPCIYSITAYGRVYVKCQDFAFTKGRPRLCHISRLVPFMQLAGVVKLTPVPEECEAEETLVEELVWVQYQLACLRKPDRAHAADAGDASTHADDETRSEPCSEISLATDSADSSWALESHASSSFCFLEGDECSIASSWQVEGFRDPDEVDPMSVWHDDELWNGEEDVDSDGDFFY